MDQGVRDYVDALPADRRAMFERVDRLVRDAYPAVEMRIAYKMPAFKVGDRELYVGAWSHGLSVYGWSTGRDDGFEARHPELSSGKGTLRLTESAMGQIDDDELRGFLVAALAP